MSGDAAVGARAAEGRHERDPSHRQELHHAPSTMTTANVGALIPFTSRRYQDPGGIYWGVDAESEDFIMLDRTALGAPHQMVFGITGSGKSFGLCRENLQILLRAPCEGLHRVPRARIQAVRSAPRR